MKPLHNWARVLIAPNGTPVGLLFGLCLIFLPQLVGYKTNTGLFWLGWLVCLAALSTHVFTNQTGSLAHVLSAKRFAALFVVYGAGWGLLLAVHYYSFHYAVFDAGQFSNMLANLWNTGRYYSSTLEMHALADHFTPNLLILSPLFGLHANFMWLQWLKVVAFLACPWILLLMSRKWMPDFPPWVLPVLWLAHTQLANTATADFQPSALALPFILTAFWLASERKWGWLAANLVFLLGFKENLPFVWVSLGAYLWLYEKHFRLGLLVAISGVVCGLVIWYGAIPYFNDFEPSHHSSRFGPHLYLPQKIELILLAVLTTGGILFASWRAWLVLLPAFGLTLVSRMPSMLEFKAHYQDIPLTVLFVVSLLAIKEVRQGRSWWCQLPPNWQKLLWVMVIAVAIGANSFIPWQPVYNHWPTEEQIELVEELRQIRTRLPEDQNVWVTKRIGVYLFDHPRLKHYWMKEPIRSQITQTPSPFQDSLPHLIVAADNCCGLSMQPERSVWLKEIQKHVRLGRYRLMHQGQRIALYQFIDNQANEGQATDGQEMEN